MSVGRVCRVLLVSLPFMPFASLRWLRALPTFASASIRPIRRAIHNFTSTRLTRRHSFNFVHEIFHRGASFNRASSSVGAYSKYYLYAWPQLNRSAAVLQRIFARYFPIGSSARFVLHLSNHFAPSSNFIACTTRLDPLCLVAGSVCVCCARPCVL